MQWKCAKKIVYRLGIVLRICLTAVYCTVKNTPGYSLYSADISARYNLRRLNTSLRYTYISVVLQINGNVKVWYQLAVLPYISNWSDWFRLV